MIVGVFSKGDAEDTDVACGGFASEVFTEPSCELYIVCRIASVDFTVAEEDDRLFGVCASTLAKFVERTFDARGTVSALAREVELFEGVAKEARRS